VRILISYSTRRFCWSI